MLNDETLGDVVLQLPVRIVGELAAKSLADGVDLLTAATKPWAVVYREDSVIAVQGKETKEDLSDCLTSLYRKAEIVSVLKKGRPVKFNMRIHASIG